MEKNGSAKTETAFEILLWIAIINQLATNWAERMMQETGLGFMHFAILLHMVRRGYEEHTVTRLAHSFQQSQPTVTKSVGVMLRKGLLRASPRANDARVKVLVLTAKGRKALEKALATLTPALDLLFDKWDDAEMGHLKSRLDVLKSWLDSNSRQ